MKTEVAADAPIPLESMVSLDRQKSALEDEKEGMTPMAPKTVSYLTMSNNLTQFKDEQQLKKLEEMLEYIKFEADKKRELIKKLDEENNQLRKKFKDTPF